MKNKKDPQELLKDRVVEVVTTMIKLCEPTTYQEINTRIKAKKVKRLRAYAKKNKEVGLAEYGTENEGISMLSIIATITDILVQDRIAFIADKKTGIIYGVDWLSKYCKESE